VNEKFAGASAAKLGVKVKDKIKERIATLFFISISWNY